MSNIATIVQFAAWLGKALGSTESVFENFSGASLGLNLPNTVTQSSEVAAALSNADSAAEDLYTASTDLEGVTPGDETELIAKFIAYGVALGEYFYRVGVLASEVQSKISSVMSSGADKSAAEALALELAKRMADSLIIGVIERYAPSLAYILKMLGLMEWGYTEADPGVSISRPYIRKSLHFERLKDLFNDPAQHFEDTIGWGDNSFDPTEFFEIYTQFFDEEDDVEVGTSSGHPFLRHGLFTISRNTQSPPGLDVNLALKLTAQAELRGNMGSGGKWDAVLEAAMEFAAGIGVEITPPLNFELIPPSGEISGGLRLFVERAVDARPFDIIGGGGLINLSADNVKMGLGADASWNTTSLKASVNPLIFAEISGGTIKIGSSGADSFIANMLGSAEIEGAFDLGIEWSAQDGLRVKASGGIEISLPIHVDLGVVKFNTLYLGMTIKDDGTLSIEVSSGLTGNLGALVATVERIGATLDIKLREDSDGSSGLFDFDLGFKPPTGVGLAVDAGVVKGGGYLYMDYDKGEYAGALELTFSDIVSLKAVGLITTKMPDGSDGFSLLVIITAEFGTGFQLGFGFVLLGVGGLLGLNRTMKLELLAEGVRSGGIESVMFPQNVVENASRIISDLKTYFPVEKGKFLIGPMAKLAWGSPVLITISLGIIIEIPGNIAILGILKVALPTEEVGLIVIQVNFIGAIEFDKDRLWFFASLYESRVLFMTLEGEMGLLVGWGDDAAFVVSVGGFHPSFNPPPLPFPSPNRIAISILNESWGKVRVTGYFAVTSNTVQFGAGVEIYFKFSSLEIDGHLAFDALFQFSPFYMIISISASFSVKVFGTGLFSVRVKMSLEGPNPWRAKGTGTIKLLFFKISTDFDVTWGESKNTTLDPIVVMPLVVAEYEKLENWKAAAPSNSNLLVSLRDLSEETDLVLHPVGTLQISQRAIPLDLTLDKIGTQTPSDANKFSVTASGSDISKKGDLEENFAIAQFQDMENSKKLSRSSFEKQNSGLELSASGDQIATGKAVKRHIRYETIIIDTNYKRFVLAYSEYPVSLFSHFFKGNSAKTSPLSKQTALQFGGYSDKVSVSAGGYSVAVTSDNKAYSAQSVSFNSQAQALEYMNTQISENPNLQNEIHVIPNTELNPAA